MAEMAKRACDASASRPEMKNPNVSQEQMVTAVRNGENVENVEDR
jgi:hypothetical protein